MAEMSAMFASFVKHTVITIPCGIMMSITISPSILESILFANMTVFMQRQDKSIP